MGNAVIGYLFWRAIEQNEGVKKMNVNESVIMQVKINGYGKPSYIQYKDTRIDFAYVEDCGNGKYRIYSPHVKLLKSSIYFVTSYDMAALRHNAEFHFEKAYDLSSANIKIWHKNEHWNVIPDSSCEMKMKVVCD